MGMTDEDIAAAKARLEAKVKIPVEPEPVPDSMSAAAASESPEKVKAGWDFLQRFKWLIVAGLAVGAVQAAITPLLDPYDEKYILYRLIALVLSALIAFVFLVMPKRRLPTDAEKETSFIHRHKWLAFFLPYLMAGIVAAAAQASIVLSLDYESGKYGAFIFSVWVITLGAGFWLVPGLVKPDALFRGLAKTSMLMGIVYVAGTQTWEVEHIRSQLKLEQVAAIEARQEAEQEILRSELEEKAYVAGIAERAKRRAELNAARVIKRAAIKSALAAFELPITTSKCDWGWLPTHFETVSYREKVQAIFADRSRKLEACLEQEMNQNFDAFSGFLSYHVGGAHHWIDSDQPARTWTELSAQMGIDYPRDVCHSYCGGQLIALRDQVGNVAQQKADEFDTAWSRYMDDVVSPAIELGDELDWEIEKQERQEKAAEEASRISRENASRNADGGFGEFIRGITQASNDMVRRTESPSNRYQRMVNENLRNEGAKRFWAKKEGITLDSKTVPNAKTGRSVGPTAERGPGTPLTKIESCPLPPIGKFCPGKPGTSEPLHPAQCASDRAETARATDNWRGSLSMYCRAQYEQRGSGSGLGKQK